jgi:hypothetical protein
MVVGDGAGSKLTRLAVCPDKARVDGVGQDNTAPEVSVGASPVRIKAAGAGAERLRNTAEVCPARDTADGVEATRAIALAGVKLERTRFVGVGQGRLIIRTKDAAKAVSVRPIGVGHEVTFEALGV